MRPLVCRLVSLAAIALALVGGAQLCAAAAAPHSTRPVALSPGYGAWCWFASPRALQFAGQTVVGYVDGAGNVRLAGYRSGQVTNVILQRRLGRDDHNDPALFLRSDGRLEAFWSAHNGPRIYFRIATAPGEITRWRAVHSFEPQSGVAGYTYLNPFQVGDRILLFYRGRDLHPALSTSTDGTRFSPGRTLITEPGQRPYVEYASDGSTVYMAFTEANPGELGPGGPSYANHYTWIYFAEFRDGRFYSAAGAPLGAPPLLATNGEVVYDGTERAWVQDIALTAAGLPVIAYAVISADGTSNVYHYAEFDGHAWSDSVLADGGPHIGDTLVDIYYSPGMTIDDGHANTVYLSTMVGSHYELQRWQTADGGATWTHAAITTDPTDNIRPIVPSGAAHLGELSLVWMRGCYPGWADFRTRVVGLPVS